MQNSTNADPDRVGGFVLVDIDDLQTSSESDITSESSASELNSSFLEQPENEANESESDNQCFFFKLMQIVSRLSV